MASFKEEIVQAVTDALVMAQDGSDDTVIAVSAKRYEELLKAEKELLALEAGGVDNWEWYYESLKEAGLVPEDF